MPENEQTTTMPQEQVQSAQIPDELRNQLAMAFGEQPNVTPLDSQPTSQTDSAVPANTATEAAQPPIEEDEIFDEPLYLKQHYGVESPDEIKQRFEELERLRNAATTPAEIKFANDQSKLWYDYIANGKEEELYNSLHAKRQIRDIDNLNEEQKIKLYIKLNNPLFDQELVDYQFNREYKFDDSAFKDEDGNVTDPMGLRFAKVAAMQKMQNDLSKANDFFSQYKTKIELPNINAPQTIADPDYDEFKASTAKSAEEYSKVIVPSVNSLKETDVQFGVKVDDPNNQMQFEINIVPDKNDFDAAKKDALNYGEYIQSSYYGNGSFNAARLQRAILLDKNFDKYAQSIARQAVNAERKRVIAKESGGNGAGRDFNVIQPEKTEFEKQVERAFAV